MTLVETGNFVHYDPYKHFITFIPGYLLSSQRKVIYHFKPIEFYFGILMFERCCRQYLRYRRLGCIRLSAFVGKTPQTISQVKELGSQIRNINKFLKKFKISEIFGGPKSKFFTSQGHFRPTYKSDIHRRIKIWKSP